MIPHPFLDIGNNRISPLRHRLKYISAETAHPSQVSCLQAADLPVDIRMNRPVSQLQVRIDKFGRHMKIRFRDQDHAGRNRRQRSQNIADSLRQGSPPHNAERYVRSELHPPLAQLLLRQPKMKQAVHADQYSRGVRTAAGQSCSDRNLLFQVDKNAFLNPEFLHQQLRGLHCKIAVVRRQEAEIRAHSDSFRARDRKTDAVKQADRLHNHAQIVIAVLPSACHVKAQIYLRHCPEIKLSHTFVLLIQKAADLPAAAMPFPYVPGRRSRKSGSGRRIHHFHFRLPESKRAGPAARSKKRIRPVDQKDRIRSPDSSFSLSIPRIST